MKYTVVAMAAAMADVARVATLAPEPAGRVTACVAQ